MPSIPLAVAPSVLSPGLALSVNLLAGAPAPGTAPLRGLLLACKDSTAGNIGTITPDTQLVEAVGGADDVGDYLGVGVQGHLCAKAIFAEYALAVIDLVAPTEAVGVKATGTITFDDTTPITVAQTATVWIAGREIQIVWDAAETDIVAATRLVAAVNALTDDLPVVAANGGGTLAVVTLTHKIKGTCGNDVTLFETLKDGTGGDITLSGAALTGGTTEPSLVAALALAAGKEYDFIVYANGNTDGALASATSGPGRIKTHIDSLDSGFAAHLQQAVWGQTGSISGAKTGAAQHNFPPLEYVHCLNGQSLGCEFAGAEVGRRLRMESIDPAVNAVNTPFIAALYGARDPIGDSLTGPELEDELQSGVTGITYTTSGTPRISRPITTYFADSRCRDVGGVSGVYAVAKDLRSAIPLEFPNLKVSVDLEPGDDELPEGVVEERDIRGFVISRLRFWQRRGVVRRDKLDEAIGTPALPGTLVVRVNPTDESQVDIVVPMAVFKIWAKTSLVVNKIA